MWKSTDGFHKHGNLLGRRSWIAVNGSQPHHRVGGVVGLKLTALCGHPLNGNSLCEHGKFIWASP